MLLYPWAYPRNTDSPDTSATDGASTRIHSAALVSFIMPAKKLAPKNMTKEQKMPTAPKKNRETRKILWVCLCLWEALASEIILDMATGMPAVETVRRMLKILKAAVKSA